MNTKSQNLSTQSKGRPHPIKDEIHPSSQTRWQGTNESVEKDEDEGLMERVQLAGLANVESIRDQTLAGAVLSLRAQAR